MISVEVPKRTVMRLPITNSSMRFKWDRDETSTDPKTDVQVKGEELIVTNFTQSTATLTLSDS